MRKCPLTAMWHLDDSSQGANRVADMARNYKMIGMEYSTSRWIWKKIHQPGFLLKWKGIGISVYKVLMWSQIIGFIWKRRSFWARTKSEELPFCLFHLHTAYTSPKSWWSFEKTHPHPKKTTQNTWPFFFDIKTLLGKRSCSSSWGREARRKAAAFQFLKVLNAIGI